MEIYVITVSCYVENRIIGAGVLKYAGYHCCRMLKPLMSVILVPVADRPECAHALGIAFHFAQKLEASLIGCHILAHRDSNDKLSPGFGSEYFTPRSIDYEALWSGRSNTDSLINAKALFARVAKNKGYEVRKRLSKKPAAIWHQRLGSPDKVMRIIGPVNDYIVVSRPTGKSNHIARWFMLASIMESGRPVLVLPQTDTGGVGKRIMIAWNQSAEVVQCVAGCLSLLKTAEAVTIVTCGPENRLGPKASQLCAYLKSWGVTSTVRKTPGKAVEKELLNAYRRTHSDLMLMGAYSRRRWREILFGGTSQFMLEKASIPIMMLHT